MDNLEYCTINKVGVFAQNLGIVFSMRLWIYYTIFHWLCFEIFYPSRRLKISTKELTLKNFIYLHYLSSCITKCIDLCFTFGIKWKHYYKLSYSLVVAKASSSLQIALPKIFVSRWVAIYLFCYIILKTNNNRLWPQKTACKLRYSFYFWYFIHLMD